MSEISDKVKRVYLNIGWLVLLALNIAWLVFNTIVIPPNSKLEKAEEIVRFLLAGS